MAASKHFRALALLSFVCLVLAHGPPRRGPPGPPPWVQGSPTVQASTPTGAVGSNEQDSEDGGGSQSEGGDAAVAFGRFGGGGSDDGGGDGEGEGRGGEGGEAGGRGGQRGGPGFDIQRALSFRTIHGIIAAIVFVVVFPVGAILMRIVPGRFTVWIHAFTQLVGFSAYVAAAGLGIYLTQVVRIPTREGTLLTDKAVNFHPIIGLVVLGGLFLQPFFGLIHHHHFKKLRTRQVWSHFHIWIGRIVITMGIINGGLGLMLANASRSLKISYGVVAGVIWLLWVFIALLSEVRRFRVSRRLHKKRIKAGE